MIVNQLVCFLALIVVVNSNITIDTTSHCDCSELRMQDCQFSSYCYWSNDQCESYDNYCAVFTIQSQCTPLTTGYQCKWEDNSCISHMYKCEEFSSNQDCPCYWNKDNKCEEYKGCSNYNEQNCPASQGCVYKVKQCLEEDYVTCSDQTLATCIGKEKLYTGCAINNDNKCDSYSLFSECSDLNNFKTKCVEYGCKYANNKCEKKQCEDLTLDECTSVKIDQKTKILCEIKQQKCVEAENTNYLNINTCYNSTSGNYKWIGNCVECDSLVYSILLTYFSLLIVVFL
ncbi:unnamed protein product [Paramecium sonneborni]|uniref:Uncharacterized protein n=1 Tax=Paramecium sonneborni TaxID=65129 RepID=A0A8S1PA94_9CILI|nr:unnamed protein product [Paramecium sonneborni]